VHVVGCTTGIIRYLAAHTAVCYRKHVKLRVHEIRSNDSFYASLM
jgi:hypothetical protein